MARKEDNNLLGNLDAQRDWGCAPEYVEAMWLMLQQDKPDDLIIATVKTHSVKKFVDEACALFGLDPTQAVTIMEKYKPPIEVYHLCGDASKATQMLGWEPKVRFKELVKTKLTHDLAKAGIDISKLPISQA